MTHDYGGSKLIVFVYRICG